MLEVIRIRAVEGKHSLEMGEIRVKRSVHLRWTHGELHHDDEQQ